MKRFLAGLLVGLIPFAAVAADLPAVYAWRPAALAAARESLARGDPGLAPALARLEGDADRALALEPRSVMDKSRTPPSGDKHDYLSQAPYWWPDPSKPNGLPYIRHDGQHNPEIDAGTDARPWGATSSAIGTLGLAYYFTHREAYAEHAALLARTWFLAPATRMNPNLQFAQYVPGVNQGRGTGILEMRSLASVCDGLALLAGSPAWTAADARGFHAWLEAYFTWVTTSRNGRDEAAATNNHGSWYDVQVTAIAFALGRKDFAWQVLMEGLTNRMARQIEPDGREPLELVRTKSLGYSLFNLQALTQLAELGERVGVDWWSMRAPDGRSLLAAVGYHAPYADPAKPWPQQDIAHSGREDLLPVLAEALRHDDNPEWRALLDRFGGTTEQRAARWRLLLDAPPAPAGGR